MITYKGLKWNKNKDTFFYSLWKSGKIKVTKTGRVFNVKTGKELGHIINGYKRISWKNKTKIYSINLHRVIWLVYGKHKPTNKRFVINHLDSNTLNCNINNLELTDNIGNIAHAKSHNRFKNAAIKGQDKPNAYFTDKEALYYRKLFYKEGGQVKRFAAKYSLNYSNLLALLSGAHYSHVGGPLKKKVYGGGKRVVITKTQIRHMRKLSNMGCSDYEIAKRTKFNRQYICRLRNNAWVV